MLIWSKKDEYMENNCNTIKIFLSIFFYKTFLKFAPWKELLCLVCDKFLLFLAYLAYIFLSHIKKSSFE